jgi:hypothetical protein
MRGIQNECSSGHHSTDGIPYGGTGTDTGTVTGTIAGTVTGTVTGSVTGTGSSSYIAIGYRDGVDRFPGKGACLLAH